ncbi:MAG: hypothetical protein FJY55_02995 [Betaproteobacteria bacterium]|nr:hypothetical protein [Betaproteobacteria bacterium]
MNAPGRIAVALACAAALSAGHAAAAELAGVKLEDRARLSGAGPELVLNGIGLRTRMVFDVYVGGLYLTEKKTAAADAVALAGPKRVAIHILRELTAQQFTESLSEGIRNNSTPAEQAALKARVDGLLDIMNAIKTVRKGDVILLDYLPETGVQVLVNGQPQGRPVPGEDFQRALLRIWLGDRPADAALKRGMLGG